MAFIVREATARTPLIPLRIFRSRNLSGANIVQPLLVAGMFGLFFMGALYMERVLGYDPLQIGFAFLPATLVMGTLSLRYAEPLITRFGAKTTLLPGLVLIAIGLALFTRAPVDGELRAARAAGDARARLRHRRVVPGADDARDVRAPPQEDAGLASGLVNTTAQVGGALGLAVLATLSTTRTDNLARRRRVEGRRARRTGTTWRSGSGPRWSWCRS